MDANIHLVIDNGSGFIKAGFSGEESPRHYFPSITGHTKVEGIYLSEEQKESIVGTEAQKKFGILNISYPIQECRIVNWDDISKIWHYTFYNELKVAPEEHNVLLTESPYNTRREREQIAEMMFETFNSPCIYLSPQSVLATYAVGKSTGLMIDCGEGSTNFSPIYEGLLMRESVTHIPIAGKMIFEFLVKKLIENKQCLDSKNQKNGCKKVKEKLCYIAQDFDSEINNNIETSSFTLPDGSVIQINKEKILAGEILFNPKQFEIQSKSLQESFMDSIKLTDSDLREDMFKNILFNGGTSLMKGFKDRVGKEINKVSEDYKCKKKVHVYPEAQFLAWIGGSVLTSLGTFQNIWVTKQEYKESGVNIVHKKCF